MPTSANIRNENNSAYQDALLLSDDPSAVNEVREFLVTNGCRVVTQPMDLFDGSYLVIHGSYDFVKSSLATVAYMKLKTLLLLIDGSNTEVASFSKIPDVKVVVLSSARIDHIYTKKIFGFYFTGKLPVLWLVPPRKIVQHETGEIQSVSTPAVQISNDILRIKKTMEELFSQTETTKTHPKTKQIKRFRITNPWLSGISVSVVLFLLPIFWLGLVLFGSVLGVFASASLLKQGEIERARDVSKFSSWCIRASDTALTISLAPVYILGLESHIVFPERMVSLLRSINDGLEAAYNSADLGKQFFIGVTAPLGSENVLSEKAPLATMMKLKNELTTLYEILGRTEADFVRLRSCRCGVFYLPAMERIGESLTEKISLVRNRVSEASALLSLYPQIGGFREKKVYLLLFQNSMELRPTGGFIGSLALVTVSDGRIQNFSVEDVYTADGQLKGHVDPPKPISLILGQEHWYLRDSNWNPDFRLSAEKAAWFYEKEMGISVNGVIGINLPFVQELLGLVGPIDLPDGNDRITKDNFFAKSLYYTEESFFPGSTQKKDFLGSLARSLIDKLLHAKSIPATTLLSLFGKSLNEKNLLVYFSDPLLTRFVSEYGWSGSAPRGSACEFLQVTSQDSCVSDGLMITEANLGVNKINYAIKRQLVHDISISEEGHISETMNFTLKNTAVSEIQMQAKGSGIYTVYLQILLPKDATRLSVLLNGKEIELRDRNNTSKPTGPYVEELDSGVTRSYGVSLAVAMQETKRVSFAFDRQAVVHPNATTFGFLLTKQPGVDDMDSEIRLTYPLYWNVKNVKSGRVPMLNSESVFLAKNSQLVYNTVLTQDSLVAVSFSK